MTASPWYPLVWGRTRRTDTWWRVLPAGLDQEGWISDVVAAVYASGLDLALPRFLLARVHGRWVTGVACRAADLDETMATDQHGRPLLTFVGWTADIADDPALPSLAEWEQSYVAWASLTYRAWVVPDWHEHIAALGGPHEATPEPVGWASSVPEDAEPLVHAPGRLVLVPGADRHALWRSGTATKAPFVLAVGWPNRRIVEPDLLTHAAVEGIEEPTQIAVSSGGPDLGCEVDPEASAETAADGRDPVDEDLADEQLVDQHPLDEDAADSADPAPDHDRSLTRGLRLLLPGNLHGRVEKLEKEVAILRAELGRLSARLAGELERTGPPPTTSPLDDADPPDER